MAQTIFIEDYSAKSFVVRGETREYKDSLKALGGKWNSRLTDKETGDKFGAWLFWSDKRSEIDGWFAKGCPDMENTRVNGSGGRKEPTHTYGSSGGTDRQTALTIQRLEAKVDRLSKMLEAVCALHDIEVELEVEEIQVPAKQHQRRLVSKHPPTKTSVEEFEVEIDDEDELSVKTPKRLLGRTKR
jgi:hypothetical protein